jgi:hypothetical protein
VRDALHAEVDSWNTPANANTPNSRVAALWTKVNELEPLSRDADAFAFPDAPASFASSTFIPVEELASVRGN